jgi:hypothetical protein
MIVHHGKDSGIPITACVLGSLTVYIAEYRYCRPFRGTVNEGRDYREHTGRVLLAVSEGAGIPAELWGCGCPVSGGPNVYGVPSWEDPPLDVEAVRVVRTYCGRGARSAMTVVPPVSPSPE